MLRVAVHQSGTADELVISEEYVAPALVFELPKAAMQHLTCDRVPRRSLIAVVKLVAYYTDEPGSVSLVWPPMSARAPKVRAFIDFMAERVSQKPY